MSATAKRAFLDEVISQDGVIHPDRLSGALRVSKSELALASGLSRDAVSKAARLREVTEVINRVLPWSGSVQQAFAWYRSQPLPAFGDQTAEGLVRAGRAEHLMRYLSGTAVGGYA